MLMAGQLALALLSLPLAGPAVANPAGQPAQWIVVGVPAANATTGTLTAFQRVDPQRIPGRVSGIFLHVTDGSPTWGCVAIGHDEMRSVLNWLDPSASPRITIGVGNPSLPASGS
jgi:hypothetical protein